MKNYPHKDYSLSKSMTSAMRVVAITLLTLVSVRGLPEDMEELYADRIKSLTRFREELPSHFKSAMEAQRTEEHGPKHMSNLRHVRDGLDGLDWLNAEHPQLNPDHLKELAQGFKKMDFSSVGQFHFDDIDFRRSMPRYEELVQAHRHGHASHMKERDVLYHHVEDRKKAAQGLAHSMARTNEDTRHSGPGHHRVDPAKLAENIEKHRPHNLQPENVHAARLDPRPAKEHLRARAHASHREAEHDGDR